MDLTCASKIVQKTKVNPYPMKRLGVEKKIMKSIYFVIKKIFVKISKAYNIF